MPPVTGSNTGAAPLRFGVLGAANINGGGTLPLRLSSAPSLFRFVFQLRTLPACSASTAPSSSALTPPARAAIIAPCFTSPDDARITALAARDRARAEEHVAEHKLEGVEIFDGYQELLDGADVDAIYVPSPNGLHYEWTMKALDAGFHVLCEKPFAS